MAKKLSIMSISIEPEMHQTLKDYTARTGTDVSKFVRKWLQQYPFDKDDVVPIVFDVPKHLLGSKAALEPYIHNLARQLVDMLAS